MHALFLFVLFLSLALVILTMGFQMLQCCILETLVICAFAAAQSFEVARKIEAAYLLILLL